MPRVNLPAGTPVPVRVPARDVVLALSQPADVSTVNRLPGSIVALERRDGTHLDAQVDIGGAVPLRVRVTHEAADRLALATGRRVWCLIKSVALDRATLLMTVESARDRSRAAPGT